MFKFLFGRKMTEDATPETMRQQVLRALAEVNAVTAEMDPKPAVCFDPVSGAIELTLPETMPDETLALPAPGADEKLEEQARQDREDA